MVTFFAVPLLADGPWGNQPVGLEEPRHTGKSIFLAFAMSTRRVRKAGPAGGRAAVAEVEIACQPPRAAEVEDARKRGVFKASKGERGE